MFRFIKKILIYPFANFYMSKFDRTLGSVFYYNNNFFSFNLFNNYLYKSLPLNSSFLKKYDSMGFIKGPNIDSLYINKINKELNKQNSFNDGSNKFEFNINDEIKKIIKKICSTDLKIYLQEFKKYYDSEIFITNVSIWKNYSFQKIDGSPDNFSESYHNDAYLKTYFKIFINIEDVNEENGPLHIIPKNLTKKFSKTINFKGRGVYNERLIADILYKNTGKINESTFFNSSMCIHRAGIPTSSNTRSMLAIVFNAIPKIKSDDIFYFEKKSYDIWNKKDLISKKYSKPSNIYDYFQNIKF